MGNLVKLHHDFITAWPFIFGLAMFTCAWFLYWLPLSMAFYKRHPWPYSVAFLNFTIGWTGIGWLYLMWRVWTWRPYHK